MVIPIGFPIGTPIGILVGIAMGSPPIIGIGIPRCGGCLGADSHVNLVGKPIRNTDEYPYGNPCGNSCGYPH
eukprot:4224686-Pyramimonas_sp.AAC.1